MANKVKLEDVERPENLSDKEYLRWLRDEGHISTVQLKGAAKRLEELHADARIKHVIPKVLREIEDGKIEVGGKVAPGPSASLPKLEDVDPNASPKQKLLELRKAGSISPREARAAAQALDQGIPVANALEAAGAERALRTLPPRLDEDGNEVTEPTAEEKREAAAAERREAAAKEDVEAAKKERGERATGPLTLADVLAGNVEDVEAVVADLENPKSLLELLSLEVQDKDRTGVKEAIERRAEALGVTDEELANAMDPSKFTGPATAKRQAEDLED